MTLPSQPIEIASGDRSKPALCTDNGPLAEPHFYWARSGDHPAIARLLRAVFHGPSRDEFQASLDDPYYEPSDRLLIKLAGRIASHVHLVKRTMTLGSQRLPISRLRHLATTAEYRGRGFASRLLATAESQMREDSASLAMLTTEIPRFFESHGWAACGRASYSSATARDILAALPHGTQPHDRHRRSPLAKLLAAGRSRPLSIRHWRHFELPALQEIYQQNAHLHFGRLDRSETYWRWLISRRAFDHIHVAVEGPDRSEAGKFHASIVGYAATRGQRIVELFTRAGRADAAVGLLSRACGDAIEHGHHAVVLHAPADDPLHELIVTAGGSFRGTASETGGPVHMAKLLDPERMLVALCDEFHRRAKSAQLPRPCQLGLNVDGEEFHLTLTRRSVRLTTGPLPRQTLRCDRPTLLHLLLGQIDLPSALETKRLHASNHQSRRIATAIFPRHCLWLPPWDRLPAR